MPSILGFVHAECSPSQFGPIQLVDRLPPLLDIDQGDKGKPAWPPRFPVGRANKFEDGPKWLEDLLQFRFSGIEGQISNK